MKTRSLPTNDLAVALIFDFVFAYQQLIVIPSGCDEHPARNLHVLLPYRL